MKSAVIVFPGSNCDRDAFSALRNVSRRHPERSEGFLGAGGSSAAPQDDGVIKVWHAESSLPKVDLVVLPGGFSYGDYLRSGAMAAHSPIMREVKVHAEKGGLVLGICNGFQILTEAGLLPGMLMRNRDLRFICKPVSLRVENADSVFTKRYRKGQLITVPVAHHDGNYFADEKTLDALEGDGRVAFRYTDNPNGSQHDIAGILSENKRVLGMMPHPERYAEALVGGTDGRALLESVLAA